MSEEVMDQVCDTYIETVSSKKFFFDPQQDISAICIGDIAHALAIEPRFGGHSLVPYSVAYHSVKVYEHYIRDNPTSLPGWRLHALLHDAHEAYTKDLMRPLRQRDELKGYNEMCKRVQQRIERRFNISDTPEAVRSDVKRYDLAMLRGEARLLMQSRGEEWVWPDIVYPEVCATYRTEPNWKLDRDDFLNAFMQCF